MYGKEIGAYRKTNVLTANPKRLVIMCYEGAINYLKVVKAKYLSGEMEEKARALQKVYDILDELLCALDLERGGEIARNLQALYNYMRRRLLDADVIADMKGVDEVINMMEELKDAWETISEKEQESGAGDTSIAHVADQSTNQGTYPVDRF
jgi:flagellar protein FliS